MSVKKREWDERLDNDDTNNWTPKLKLKLHFGEQNKRQINHIQLTKTWTNEYSE